MAKARTTTITPKSTPRVDGTGQRNFIFALEILTVLMIFAIWVRIEMFTSDSQAQRTQIITTLNTTMDDRFRGKDAEREFTKLQLKIDELSNSIIKVEKQQKAIEVK